MKSADFLDAVRTRHGLNSDNKAAKLLGIKQSRVSMYRTGKREFSDETAQIVAAALDTEAGWVMAEIAAERAKRTDVADAWRRLAALARHSAAMVTGFLSVGLVALAWGSQAANGGLCILRQIAGRVGLARLWRALRPSPAVCERCGFMLPTVQWRGGRLLCLACHLREPIGTVTGFLAARGQMRDRRTMKSTPGARSRGLFALVIPLMAAVAGCAGVSTEILVGSKIADGGFEGTGPTATLRVRKRLNDRAFCEYEHVSHVVVDRRDEVQLDQVGCGFRFGSE